MKQKILLLITSLIVCVILTEITLSFMITKDLDGNLVMNNLHIKPYRLPIKETKVKLNKLLSLNNNNVQNIRLIPDSKLGWIPGKYFESNNSLYKYNNESIRVYNTKWKASEKKKIRIAIFGDSYSHGDEVKFEYTIGNYLEKLFNNEKYEVEVLNFAVSGYGFDQAYLRWEEVNSKFKPDIIILGVQFENVKRNINIIRPFYSHITDIPYSKPRFILNNNKLELLKNPLTDISKIANIITNIDDWEYCKYEGFYNPENYRSDFWLNFNTYSTITSLIYRLKTEFGYYNPKSESYRITKKIFNLFKANVVENGQIFIPVHLPTMDDFNFWYKSYLKYFHSRKFIYDELYDDLRLETQFVETFDKLEHWSLENNVEKLFMKRHYSAVANEIIAKQIYNYIMNEHLRLFNN